MRRLVYSAALLLVAACGDPDDVDGGNLPGHMGEAPSSSGGNGGLAQRPNDQSGGSTSTGAVTGSGGTDGSGGSDDGGGSGTGGSTDPGDTGGSGGTEGSGGTSSGGSGGSDNEDNPGTGGTGEPPEEELMSWPDEDCEGFTFYRVRPGECLWVNGDFYQDLPGSHGCYAETFTWNRCANAYNSFDHDVVIRVAPKPGRTYGVARFEGGCEIRCKEN